MKPRAGAVLGSGGWGTALALVLLENGHQVRLWSYLEEESATLRARRENPVLPGVTLPEELELTADINCVKDCGVVVLATPSFAVRTTARQVKPLLEPGAVIVSVSKGVEKDTSLTLTEVFAREVGESLPIVALSANAFEEDRKRAIACGMNTHLAKPINISKLLSTTLPEASFVPEATV